MSTHYADEHSLLHVPRDYSNIESIPYCNEPPTYHQFRDRFLDPNIPVLIGPSLTAPWRARQQWVCAQTGKPDFDRLRDQLCQQPVEVPVADCATRDYTDQKRSTMDLKQFLDEWEAKSLLGEPSRTYLKDFHFIRAFPSYGAYETPAIFRDDWMNEFWTRRADLDDDYRFVYCGGDATFTPFHADVYRSYSWSANICGVKKWTLFPPGQEHLFRDSLRNTVYDIENVDSTQFPLFQTAKRFTVFQEPGQTLFVPSGWWHQVHNIGDTISINHNWCNGSNLDLILESLCLDLKEVQQEIEHLKGGMEESEWIETCQRLLLANSGWDWSTLWQLCKTVEDRVKRQMDSQDDNETLEKTTGSSRVHGQVRRTPIFPPPTLKQQPPLELTKRRLDSVFEYIRKDSSASWFLTQNPTLANIIEPAYTTFVHSSIRPVDLQLTPIAGLAAPLPDGRGNVAFTIESFLSPQECQSLIQKAEERGFRKELLSLGSPDHPRAYIPDYRHSLRNEVIDPELAAALWSRVSKFIPQEHIFDHQVHPSIALGQEDKPSAQRGPPGPEQRRERSMTAVGLDPKIRFLKYEKGHQFMAHMDAEYEDPNGHLGLLTFQIYLNEGYQGGETSFIGSEPEEADAHLMAEAEAAMQDLNDGDEIVLPPLRRVHCYPELGKALIFQRDLVHEAARVTEGAKYVVGIDVMFKVTPLFE
ncbi:JmjC domain-containing protein 4 [Gryganskiella cystojenkinii]|nr:JmjC domain-containing protein 4 [Gryganskiella cystojenkinii]